MRKAFIVNEAESFKDKAGKIDYSYTVNKAGVDITDISEDGSVHTFKAPELTDGTYTITFKYTDGAGNIMKSDSEKLTGGIYMSQTIVVDTKMPIISKRKCLKCSSRNMFLFFHRRRRSNPLFILG